MKIPFLILFSFLIYFVYSVNSTEPYEVYYRWKKIDYNYDGAPMNREEMIGERKYIPQNIYAASLKVSRDKIFLSTPRFFPGVPSTLNSVPYYGDKKHNDNARGPLLNPYPNWEMQEIGNCTALQSVVATEIDQWDRMWVIDNGLTELFSDNPNNKCPPKIVLIDLSTDKVIYTYIFPADVLSNLNDFPVITVACTCAEDCMLYIPEVVASRLIMYDHYRKRSWYVTHPTMLPDPKATNFTILGETYNFSYGICSIALSPSSQNHDTFYYAPLAGFTVYKVRTAVLKSAPCGSALKDKDVIKVITRPSQSDGMTMDAKGRLYYGSLEGNALEVLNTNNTLHAKPKLLAQSDTDFQWIGAFGFDNQNEFIMFVTNRFPHIQHYNFSDYNFRVLRRKIDTQSYIY